MHIAQAFLYLYHLLSYATKISLNFMEYLHSAVCLVVSYIMNETEIRSQASRDQLEE